MPDSPLIKQLLATLPGGPFPDFVADFSHTPGTRVVFGRGAVQRTGIFARSLGAHRVMVVTDRGIAEAGHLDHVLESLNAAGVEWSAFMGVEENPTTDPHHTGEKPQDAPDAKRANHDLRAAVTALESAGELVAVVVAIAPLQETHPAEAR